MAISRLNEQTISRINHLAKAPVLDPKIPMTPTQILCKSDPILAKAIARVIKHFGVQGEDADTATPPDHFVALCGIVAGQQLSTHVARAIRGRLEAHFAADFSADSVAATDHETLRTLGLSGAKARTLHALAAHILDGHLPIAQLEKLSNEEITREIVAVKGLGPWSADMFLMFHLHRADVLPVGDLGIREAARRLYDLDERPDAAKLTQIAEVWRPHRTLASRYLWRYLDVKDAI